MPPVSCFVPFILLVIIIINFCSWVLSKNWVHCPQVTAAQALFDEVVWSLRSTFSLIFFCHSRKCFFTSNLNLKYSLFLEAWITVIIVPARFSFDFWVWGILHVSKWVFSILWCQVSLFAWKNRFLGFTCELYISLVCVFWFVNLSCFFFFKKKFYVCCFECLVWSEFLVNLPNSWPVFV